MKPVFLLIALAANLALGAQYVSPDKKISLEYDASNWEVVPNPPPAAQDVDKAMAEKTLVTLQRKIPDDKYRARFSVVMDDLAKFKPDEPDLLLAYQKKALKFLKGQRFAILSTSPMKLPGVDEPAIETVANQRDFGLTFRQVIFVKGNEAYLLTAAARTAKFESYAPEIKRIFDSIKTR